MSQFAKAVRILVVLLGAGAARGGAAASSVEPATVDQAEVGSAPASGGSAAAGLVRLCRGHAADPTGVRRADRALQACIDATPAGGVLAIPYGTYLIGAMLQISQPLTLKTANTDGEGSCYNGIVLRSGVACATLKAADSYVQPASAAGFVHIANTTSVHLSHLIFDGNIEGRSRAGNVITPCSAQTQCPNVVFDLCNPGTYFDPLTNTNIALGNGQPSQACSLDNSAAINAVGMGAVNVKRSLSFNFSTNNIMYNGRFLREVPGDINGGSDGLSTWDHVDGIQIVNNQFIDNSDGGISINGGVRYGYIAYNQILQYNETAGNGIVLARLPYDVLDTANWTGTVVEGNYIDGCTTDNCVAPDRYGCDHAQNSYLQVGIFIGSDGWTHVDAVQAPIWGFTVRNNVIRRVSRGIQLAGVGGSDASMTSTLTGNTMQLPRVLGDGTFHDCHMSPTHGARFGAGLAWCQNAAPGQCDLGRKTNAGASSPQGFAFVTGLINGNVFQDGFGLNASLDYFSGY